VSKQDEIITHIKMLEPGHKISVRSIASELGVSEGTAYRAIKECETLGIVSTIPKNLNRFVIGATTVDAFTKYITPGCLVIVGNREEIQEYALTNEAAVLISGGFSCSEKIKALANEKNLPIMSSTYDTFTIASMINQAIHESKIKKDIILVEELMNEDPSYLKVTDDLEAWKEMVVKTKHIRYPVVDNDMKVVGIITARDMPINMLEVNESIGKLMRKDAITVTPKTTVSYAANIMG